MGQEAVAADSEDLAVVARVALEGMAVNKGASGVLEAAVVVSEALEGVVVATAAVQVRSQLKLPDCGLLLTL